MRQNKSTDRLSVHSETALRHLSELRPAPSAGLQDIPRESLGEHLGFSSREAQTDDLDGNLARQSTRGCTEQELT